MASSPSLPPLVTVCTPTFNRAPYLPRVHRSLLDQTFSDFEWLVVDDGSTDDTREAVERLAAESPFPVLYLWKENGGKHSALNAGLRAARGRYFAILDSDDWYLPDSLDRLVDHWRGIDDPARFAEVQGLSLTRDGAVLGDPYPADVFDSDYFTNYEVLRLKGDRTGMFRTDVLRQFPFPEEFGNVAVPEMIVLNRISRRFRVRGLNEAFAQKEYLPAGLTRAASVDHIALSAARLLYLEELVELAGERDIPFHRRLKHHANLIRNSLHQRRPLTEQLARSRSRLLWVAAFPLGVAAFGRDHVRSRSTRIGVTATGRIRCGP